MADGKTCFKKLKKLSKKWGINLCWGIKNSRQLSHNNTQRSIFIRRSALSIEIFEWYRSYKYFRSRQFEYTIDVYILIPEDAEIIGDGEVSGGEKISILKDDKGPWVDYLDNQIDLMGKEMEFWKQEEKRKKEQIRQNIRVAHQQNLERANATFIGEK